MDNLKIHIFVQHYKKYFDDLNFYKNFKAIERNKKYIDKYSFLKKHEKHNIEMREYSPVKHAIFESRNYTIGNENCLVYCDFFMNNILFDYREKNSKLTISQDGLNFFTCLFELDIVNFDKNQEAIIYLFELYKTNYSFADVFVQLLGNKGKDYSNIYLKYIQLSNQENINHNKISYEIIKEEDDINKLNFFYDATLQFFPKYQGLIHYIQVKRNTFIINNILKTKTEVVIKLITQIINSLNIKIEIEKVLTIYLIFKKKEKIIGFFKYFSLIEFLACTIFVCSKLKHEETTVKLEEIYDAIKLMLEMNGQIDTMEISINFFYKVYFLFHFRTMNPEYKLVGLKKSKKIKKNGQEAKVTFNVTPTKGKSISLFKMYPFSPIQQRIQEQLTPNNYRSKRKISFN